MVSLRKCVGSITPLSSPAGLYPLSGQLLVSIFARGWSPIYNYSIATMSTIGSIYWNPPKTDTIETSVIVLYTKVFLVQRLTNTVMYYFWTGQLSNKEVSYIQRILSREVALHIPRGVEMFVAKKRRNIQDA